MSYKPLRPFGSGESWMFFKAVWDFLWGGKFPFKNTDTVKVEWDGTNYSFKAAPPKEGSGSNENVWL